MSEKILKFILKIDVESGWWTLWWHCGTESIVCVHLWMKNWTCKSALKHKTTSTVLLELNLHSEGHFLTTSIRSWMTRSLYPVISPWVFSECSQHPDCKTRCIIYTDLRADVEIHLLGSLNTSRCVWFWVAGHYVLSPLLQGQHWFWENGLWAGWLNKLLEFSASLFIQGHDQTKFVLD